VSSGTVSLSPTSGWGSNESFQFSSAFTQAPSWTSVAYELVLGYNTTPVSQVIGHGTAWSNTGKLYDLRVFATTVSVGLFLYSGGSPYAWSSLTSGDVILVVEVTSYA
jgi:hypothetical protein